MRMATQEACGLLNQGVGVNNVIYDLSSMPRLRFSRVSRIACYFWQPNVFESMMSDTIDFLESKTPENDATFTTKGNQL